MFFKKKPPDSSRSDFRSRQRPVQGSYRESSVYSYRASRSSREDTLGRITPDEAAKTSALHKQLRWLKKAPNIALVCVVLLLVLYGLHLSPHAKVVPMEDTKSQVFLRSLKTYETAAQQSFVHSFSNNNKLTVNTTQVASDLTGKFPELKTVAISLPLFGDQPVVYLQPATPALILHTRSSGSFIVATSGKALIQGDQVPNLDKLKLPTVDDQSGIGVHAGDIALPNSSVSFIAAVVGQLEAKQLSISSLTLPAGTSELDVRISGLPYYVKCNLQGDGRAEAGAYLAVKQQLEAQHKTPSQYVDVRVENRAYFK